MQYTVNYLRYNDEDRGDGDQWLPYDSTPSLLRLLQVVDQYELPSGVEPEAFLHRLAKEGWTPTGVRSLAKAASWSDDTPVTEAQWRAATDADDWIALCGDAATASLCLEAGLRLVEVATMFFDGTFDRASVEMLAVLSRRPVL